MLKIGREYTNPRDAPRTERNGVTGANTRIGPIHDMLIAEQYGRYSIEVKIDSQLLGLSYQLNARNLCTMTAVQSVQRDS